MCLQSWGEVRARKLQRHGALGLLRMDSLCPTWACAQPHQLPREAVNRPPHLLPFTSPHKPSLPHLSSPHKYHIHMPSDPQHSAHRPAPTQLRPASTYLSPLHTHTHTHTRTHTHFTVRNKHRPCRLWKAGGRGRWCFPSGSQN